MKKLQNKKGFTLVEMIVVLAIIAILIALLAPNVARLIKNAQTTSDNAKAKTVMNTGQAYATDATTSGNNLIAGSLPTITSGTVTTGYVVTLAPVGASGTVTGDSQVKAAFYATVADAPSFMDNTGDSYLPENTIKNNDRVILYLSPEGAVMGTVLFDVGGTGTAQKIKAVAGVAPAGTLTVGGSGSATPEFTTSDLREKGTIDPASGKITYTP